jgi:AraC-like DNA-binding protein
LKTVTGKTTSQLIQERVLQESQTLLKHTDWNIAEIGYAVGFDDPSHFTFSVVRCKPPQSYSEKYKLFDFL